MLRLPISTLFPYRRSSDLVLLTVRAPLVGLLVSGVMVKVLLLVRLALLWAVTVWLPLADRERTRLKSSYTVKSYASLRLMLKPLGLGKLSLRMPESLSVED